MTKQARIFGSAQRPLIEKPDRERYACLDHRWASMRAARYFFSRLSSQSRERVIVSLPYKDRRADVDRFRALRVGDYVKVEGRFLDRDRFDLEGFLRGNR